MKTKQNNQNGRRSEEELERAMLELVKAGRSGEEIMSELNITRKTAESTHYRLIQKRQLTMECLTFPRGRRIRVTEIGVSIPQSRIAALGLGTTFKSGTPVRLSARGNSLVIEPDVIRKVRATVCETSSLLAIDWDGFADDVIAMGESDESIA